MGSDITSSHLANSFLSKSKQISICSSPAPATIFYPVLSSIVHCTKLSDFYSFFIPLISFTTSYGFLDYTATLTTGDTLYFIDFIQ